VLASIAASIGADFANGDTMITMPGPFFADSEAAGAPLALQPEGGGALETLAWTKWGWGYWGAPTVPAVDSHKWVEHRHASQICNRWGTAHTPTPSHTLDLQQALFNGNGFVAWENIWGTWNGLSARDAEATRRVGALLRFLAPFFSAGPEGDSTTWTPHALVTPESYAAGVFASHWALPAGSASPYKGDAAAWTVVGYGGAAWQGATLPVPCGSPLAYFDLYAGKVARPVNATSGGCALPLAVEAGGFGAALALGAADGAPPPARLADFLAQMAEMTARPLATFDTAPTLLQQVMTVVEPAPLPAAPPGTVLVPGAIRWPFTVAGTEIEGRKVDGNDVQFPWETIATTAHASHGVDVPNLFVDATPVTNAAYSAFLKASGVSVRSRPRTRTHASPNAPEKTRHK
jgi:iron(II)-dependent oxidoreductase